MMDVKVIDRRHELYIMASDTFKPKSHPMYGGAGYCRVNPMYKKIHFYEWSNPDSAPLTFYTQLSFENYLRMSGIPIKEWESDVIKRMAYEPHVACKKGCKNLVIASTKAQLKHLINNTGWMIPIHRD